MGRSMGELECLGYEVERPTYESLFHYPDSVRHPFEAAR